MTSEMLPLLFSEKPYVAVLSKKDFQSQKMCFSCFKRPPKTFQCSKCHLACYCSVDCQTEDWKTGQHLRECKVFASFPEGQQMDLNSELLRLVARVLVRKAKDGGVTDGSEMFPIKEMKFQKLSDLHWSLENISESRFKQAWSLFGFLYASKSRFFAGIDQDTFCQVLSIVDSNAFGIYDLDILEGPMYLGAGLYLQSSRFRHSCDPELSSIFEGSTLQICQLKPIALTDLDSLTIRYRHRDAVSLTSERQMSLETIFHFKCECTLCRDEKLDRIKDSSVAAKCPKCDKNLVVTMEGEARLECLHCGQQIPGWDGDARVARALILKIRNFFNGEADQKQIKYGVSFIQMATERLDSLKNIWLLRLREDAFNQQWEQFRSMEKAAVLVSAQPPNRKSLLFASSEGAKWYEVLRDLVEQVVATYRFYGVDSSVFPIICAKLAEVQAAAGDAAQAKEWLEEAWDLWANVVCTPGHHCVADIQAKIEELSDD